MSSKRKLLRKKHWPLNINIHIPGRPDPLNLEVGSAMKIKNLKGLIHEKIGGGDEMPIERMQLQVEGGEILNKNTKSLDDYDVKDGSNVILEILDKANAPTPRERKPRAQKDEPKVEITYNVKG